MSNFFLKTVFISLSSLVIIYSPARGQLLLEPDNTLGTESSKKVLNRTNTLREDINGGAIRGKNLFHSFREFNVNLGREVYFNNPPGVENILTRVTGQNISSILGRLGVIGGANLYLINPNGIFFGNSTFLDIRGSFMATTADGISLGNSGFFSAINPVSDNLLTVTPGALFINRSRNSARVITNQANLEVAPGQNITLSADVINSNGSINARGGKVFLEAINGDINLKNINKLFSI